MCGNRLLCYFLFIWDLKVSLSEVACSLTIIWKSFVNSWKKKITPWITGEFMSNKMNKFKTNSMNYFFNWYDDFNNSILSLHPESSQDVSSFCIKDSHVFFSFPLKNWTESVNLWAEHKLSKISSTFSLSWFLYSDSSAIRKSPRRFISVLNICLRWLPPVSNK